MQIFIGTSGWNYPHWKYIFYPENLDQKEWLIYYANFFNAIELNVTFYRNIKENTFKKWYKITPKNFYFVAKGPRLITHIKRLKNTKKEVNLFFENVLLLKEKLTCILWQLPPKYKKNLKILENFLKIIKKYKIKGAFEFRNTSWFDKETYDLLKSYNFALCIIDSDCWQSIREITANFTYIRFHGKNGLYSGNYSIDYLKEYADFIKKINLDTFVFFNNDAYGYAIKNALDFKNLFKNN